MSKHTVMKTMEKEKMKTAEEMIQYIAIVRKEAGINQDEMAAHVGVTRTQITNLEASRCGCSLSRFLKMCELLDIKLSEFEDEDNTGRVCIEMKRHRELKAIKAQIADLKIKKQSLIGDRKTR